MLIEAPALVLAAGALQLLQLPGMVIGQRLLGWRDDLAQLRPVNRRLVMAFGVGVFLYVVGSGLIAMREPRSFAESPLGVSLCLLQALAWSARAVQQRFSIGPVWPHASRWLHRALLAIYSTLAVSYAAVCALFFASSD